MVKRMCEEKVGLRRKEITRHPFDQRARVHRDLWDLPWLGRAFTNKVGYRNAFLMLQPS